jgi:hypothetical protein
MVKRLAAGDTFVVDFDAECECGNHATHLLTIHAVDYCTADEPNRTGFVCQACLTRAYALAAKLLHPSTKLNFCGSCYLTLDSLSGIIVSLVPIPPQGGSDA